MDWTLRAWRNADLSVAAAADEALTGARIPSEPNFAAPIPNELAPFSEDFKRLQSGDEKIIGFRNEFEHDRPRGVDSRDRE